MIFIPHWPKTFGKKNSIKLDLEMKFQRILKVLELLKNPHLKIPPVIHVGGTNGKGSVVSYITNILQNSGYKVHKYISPHLIHFNERIVLNNKEISNEYLFDIVERTRIATENAPFVCGQKVSLSLFEATTIASFLAFSEVSADFLVLEVGMGGVQDPTNLVENTILSVLTPISLDHQEFLGDTHEMIANEKAGIIKTNIPVVCGPQRKDVLKVIEYHAMLKKAPIYRYGHEFSSKFLEDKNFFEYQNLNQNCEIKLQTNYPIPALRGPHQTENAATAIAASEILNKRHETNIFYEHIETALKKTFWPARIQKIETGRIKNLVPQNWEIFLDGAHNPSGAQTLARWIENDNKNRSVYMIFGTTRGKDLTPYLLELKDSVKFTCCVCVFHETNAYLGSEILKMAEKIDMNAKAFDFATEALTFLKEDFYEKIPDNQKEEDSIILICGSLYLAGDVLNINNGFI